MNKIVVSSWSERIQVRDTVLQSLWLKMYVARVG